MKREGGILGEHMHHDGLIAKDVAQIFIVFAHSGFKPDSQRVCERLEFTGDALEDFEQIEVLEVFIVARLVHRVVGEAQEVVSHQDNFVIPLGHLVLYLFELSERLGRARVNYLKVTQ